MNGICAVAKKPNDPNGSGKVRGRLSVLNANKPDSDRLSEKENGLPWRPSGKPIIIPLQELSPAQKRLWDWGMQSDPRSERSVIGHGI